MCDIIYIKLNVRSFSQVSEVGYMNVKEQLILAGIEELEERGIQELSLRRVATRCGVSCAAPYKHFKDKQDFILGMIRYINGKWQDIQNAIMSRHDGDMRRKLLDVCMGYVRFLVDNPHFHAVIVMLPGNSDPEQVSARHELSADLKRLVHDYCVSLKIPEKLERCKLYTVRSLIYGAAMFIDSGQLPDNDDTMSMVRESISSELNALAVPAQ